MDKFRVGQMIRKVRVSIDSSNPLPIGTIATITSQRQLRINSVQWFGYDTDLITELGMWCPCQEDIALVYDGDQPASWEDCAWKPEKVKE